MKYTTQGTVLIFTLVLVVLGVFMAMVTLNLTQRIEYDLQIRQINDILSDGIQVKTNIVFDYARYLNSTGSGFIDNIGCPTNITLSGSVFDTFSTSLVYRDELMFCESDTSYGGIVFQIYFNEDFDDLEYLEFDGEQILFSSDTRQGILNSFEEIFVDGTASFPLEPDGIDDNFDSDNYMISSTGSLLYPDGYIDNDANHRIHNFGFIPPSNDWYNILWVNQSTLDFIESNTNNIDPLRKLGDISEGLIYLESDQNYDIRLIRFNRESYREFNELLSLRDITGEGVQTGSGFIQSNLNVIDSNIGDFDLSGDEYIFDFTLHDYAIFLRNRSSDTLLTYQIRVRDIDNNKVYFVPVVDDSESVISMLGNHIIFSKNGIAIGEQQEIIGRK